MHPSLRAEINRKNAANSTGPKSDAGKQASSMNGFKHGLTGQRMILQEHEVEPYRHLTHALHADYKPQSEIEYQLLQKIVDCNMRLNRAAAIDANLMNIGVIENTRHDAIHDDITETVIAQTRSWVKQADSFEKLGRYEARISRQMLQYMRELDRVQNLRKSPIIAKTAESKPDNPKLALVRTNGQALSSQPSGQGQTPVVRALVRTNGRALSSRASGQGQTPVGRALVRTNGQALSSQASGQGQTPVVRALLRRKRPLDFVPRTMTAVSVGRPQHGSPQHLTPNSAFDNLPAIPCAA